MDNNKNVENQNKVLTPKENLFKRFLTKRNIFTVLGMVIVVEVIWAGLVLTKSSKQTSLPEVTKSSQSKVEVKKPTVISLKASGTQIKIGEKVNVSLEISSDKATDGTDLIIIYDPKMLQVQTLLDTNQAVVVTGLYNDYPVNSFDDKSGRIKVSGVSTKQGGIIPTGLFGTITFVAKGTGATDLTVEYTPGSTIDSNVIESGSGGKDILEKVENIKINILP